MTERARDFSLPNLSIGPDPFSLDSLPADVSFVALFFQRDYYCTNCRKQVRQLADRIDAFRERDTEVVSILPEPVDRVAAWQEKFDLPYPLLADPDTEASDAYDQPVRFGILGQFSDFFGRMPEVVLVDRRHETPEVVYVHRGSSTFDRPDIDEILDEIDDASDEPIDDASDEATDEASDEAIDDASDEATDEASDEATDEATDEPIVEATDDASHEATDEATDDASHEAIDEATDDASHEAIDEATDDASDDATGETR
jgi:peroxiredoxin Q/BCP